MNISSILRRRMLGMLIPAMLTVAACNSQTGQNVDGDYRSATVTSPDGVPIRYEDHGEGSPALVLIHGWSCDRRYWSEQVSSLSNEHRVITIDLGGHGESGLARDEWTIASFGADVAAVVEQLGLDSVVLVGHSMGGDVIFQAARLLPGKVDALMMIDTYKQLGAARSDAEIDEILVQFSADFPAVTEKFVRSLFPPNTDPDLVDWVSTDMASAPRDVALSSIQSSFRHAREIPNLIRDLRIPIVTINPDDTPTDIASMKKYDIDVKIMKDVGHFLMMEDPDGFNRLLLEALDDIQGDTR